MQAVPTARALYECTRRQREGNEKTSSLTLAPLAAASMTPLLRPPVRSTKPASAMLRPSASPSGSSLSSFVFGPTTDITTFLIAAWSAFEMAGTPSDTPPTTRTSPHPPVMKPRHAIWSAGARLIHPLTITTTVRIRHNNRQNTV